MNIDIPEFTVSKGFLAQAKLIRKGKTSGTKEELKSQCEKILKLSPDSFVFLYDTNDVWVVPAIAVVGIRGKVDPQDLYRRRAQTFFEEHFECFIGDGNISTASPNTLESLRAKYEARIAIEIRAVRHN